MNENIDKAIIKSVAKMAFWTIALGFYATTVILFGYNYVLCCKELVRLCRSQKSKD